MSISSDNNVTRKNNIIHLYQYVLDSKTVVVRGELYEHLILKTLYDHAKKSSLSTTKIVDHIETDYNLTNLPFIHIEPAISRLKSKKWVVGKECLALTSDKTIEIKQHNQIFIEDMKIVLEDLEEKIKKRIPDLSIPLVKDTVKNFYKLLGKTFTTYGKVAAKLIIDQQGTINSLKNYKGFREDYNELVLNLIPEHLQDSIDEIFNEFFFDPTEKQSKFFYNLAQSHTLLEILNVDPTLQKIQKNALNKTKMFLDTNVIIYLLFEKSRQYDSIYAVIERSKQLGATFYINTITKKEFERWLENNKCGAETIRKIPQKLTDALSNKKIDAPLLTAYADSLKQNPRQSIDQFCLQFEDVSKVLKNKFGVELDEEDIDVYQSSKSYVKLESSIQNITRFKGPNVVKHDALCILKIKEYRKDNLSNEFGPKAWFLTTDSSLWRAERNAFPSNEIRASITSAAWLPIISPLISPELKTSNTIVGFSKLLSMNFGTGSIISQEDILNITSAFIDDKYLTVEDLSELIGDKRVRDSLRNLHNAHDKNDRIEEERWTKIGLEAVTKRLKGKHERETDGYKKSIKQFTKRLDSQDGKLQQQSDQIQSQSKEIRALNKEKHEKKWQQQFLIGLCIAIAVVVAIPVVLFYTNIVTITGDVLAVVGIEICGLSGIFLGWLSYHKLKTK